ncbi:MAG: hypothetical protein AB7V08_08665 [Elusimicrobiales bacterium]
MQPIPAQEMVSLVHTKGIEAAIERSRMIASNQGTEFSNKDALYEIILAAKHADCPMLAAAACVMYEKETN